MAPLSSGNGRFILLETHSTVRVRNMGGFNSGKWEVRNVHTFSESQKLKQFLEREALNDEYLWKSSCLFTSDFIASYFVLSPYF